MTEKKDDKVINKEIELELKKYGNSYGFHIPKAFIEAGLLKVNKKYKVPSISESGDTLGLKCSLAYLTGLARPMVST